MSPFEADNWRQFAMRMAFESNHWRTHARRAKVVGTVGELIDQFLHNYELDLIGDWDGNQINGRGGRMEERYGRPHLEIAYPCDEFDEARPLRLPPPPVHQRQTATAPAALGRTTQPHADNSPDRWPKPSRQGWTGSAIPMR
jgi:hypothetical protein